MGPIEEDKPKGELRKTPYGLPAEFEWSDLDIKNDDQAEEVRLGAYLALQAAD